MTRIFIFCCTVGQNLLNLTSVVVQVVQVVAVVEPQFLLVVWYSICCIAVEFLAFELYKQTEIKLIIIDNNNMTIVDRGCARF